MKKSDLKSRMVVEFRNGSRRMVVIKEDGDMIFIRKGSSVGTFDMNEDMTRDDPILNVFDIVKVFDRVYRLDDIETTQILLWERQEYYSGKIICVDESGCHPFKKERSMMFGMAH